MKQAYVIEVHAPSMSVKNDRQGMPLRKAGWRRDLLDDLREEYHAIIQGPTFENGTAILLVANGRPGDLPRRGNPEKDVHNRITPPRGYLPLKGLLRGDWVGNHAERHALRGWMEKEETSITRSLHDQIRNHAHQPAPVDGHGSTVADELKRLADWLIVTDQRALEFEFAVGQGDDRKVAPGPRNPGITVLNERLAGLLPVLLPGAGLPCRAGMTGSLSLFDSGKVCVTGKHPDTGWQHSRIVKDMLGTQLRDIQTPCAPHPASPIRELRDMIGDVDQEIWITARVEYGLLASRPEIAFANRSGDWGEDMNEEQLDYLGTRLDVMVPDILRAGWAAALRADPDPEQTAEDFPSYEARSFGVKIQIDEINMLVEVTLENEAGARLDLNAHLKDADVENVEQKFADPELDEIHEDILTP